MGKQTLRRLLRSGAAIKVEVEGPVQSERHSATGKRISLEWTDAVEGVRTVEGR